MTSMLPWWKKRVRRTTLIMIGALAFLGGLALPLVGVVYAHVVLPVVAAVLLLFCIKKWWLVAVPAVIASGLLLGVWRGSEMGAALKGYQPYVAQKVTLRAVVKEDTTYNDKRQLDLRATEVTLDGKHLPGTLRVTTFDPVQPRRGETIEVTGKLMDGFGSYQAAIYYANVTVLERPVSWHEQIRRQFMAAIFSILPEPQASLGLGFLIGLKSSLPDKFDDQLRLLGLTHIIVASGFNLTILVRLARRLFARFSKYQATLMSVLLMSGFLLVTGFSASMSRAALVTSLSLAAWYYGRKIHPVVLLLVAAAITTAINPLYLWSDLGWWLSFLAFAGVMLGAPLIQWRMFGEKQPPALMQVAIETVCAQLTTLPLIMLIFGTFSVLSLPANLLIVPFIPLAMLLTLIAGLAGLLTPLLAPWAALPALWLLRYVTEIVDWLGRIPWASVPLKITAVEAISSYAALIVAGWLMCRKAGFDYQKGTSIVE